MSVAITPSAKREVLRRVAQLGSNDAALLLCRKLPNADLTRGQDGEARWNIQRTTGWFADVERTDYLVELAAKAKRSLGVDLSVIRFIDGVPVALLEFGPPPTLRVSLRRGQLHATEPDA